MFSIVQAKQQLNLAPALKIGSQADRKPDMKTSGEIKV